MTDSDSNRLPVNRKLLTRLFSKIKMSTEHFYKGEPCWDWQDYLHNGYGHIHYIDGKKPAHRMMYQCFVAIIPRELVCDHLCRRPCCVNPLHIEPVTERVNLLRGVGASAVNAKKTHCPQGHAYTPQNTWTSKRNLRYCKKCHCDREKARYARKKEQATLV